LWRTVFQQHGIIRASNIKPSKMMAGQILRLTLAFPNLANSKFDVPAPALSARQALTRLQ